MAPLSPSGSVATRDPASPPKAVTQRGVYSEVVLNGTNRSADHRTAAAVPRTVQSQPRARRFNRGARAAATREVAVTSDSSVSSSVFPPSAYEPKVQCPHETRPGVTPRKIEVKRKQELYASQNITELLAQLGTLHPAAPGTEDALSLLPLEAFDDTEYESRPPSVWLAMGTAEDGSFVGIPAKGVRPSAPEGEPPAWCDCKVVGYSPSDERWTVEWLKDGVAERDVTNDRTTLPRIDLLFAAEDPWVFAERVATAYKRRRSAESALRYNLYVDCMPYTDLPQLDTEQVNRVLSSALNTRSLKQNALDTTSLLNEVNIDYSRTMNKIIFDLMHSNVAEKGEHHDTTKATAPSASPQAAESKTTASSGSGFGVGSLFSVLEAPRAVAEAHVPESGVYHIPGHNFAEQFANFSFASLLTQGGVIVALDKVRNECNKVSASSLFNTSITKSVRLEEFEHLENTSSTTMANFLKEHWTMAIKNHVRSSFKDVGKGWFNLKENSREVYKVSKLKRFFTLVNSQMQDTLRFVLIENIYAFCTFMETACEGEVNVVSPTEVNVSYPSASTKRRRVPLFAVDLVVGSSAEGPIGANNDENVGEGGDAGADEGDANKESSVDFAYSTNPEDFTRSPLTIFDKALGGLQSITQVERFVMTELFWSSEPMMMSVHPSEPWVVSIRERISTALRRAVKPLKLYLKTYDSHLAFLRLSMEDFMAQVEQECAVNAGKAPESPRDEAEEGGKRPLVILDPVKVKKLVLQHREAKLEIERSIPNTMSIGLFAVSCTSVRNMLAEKHQAIADALLELLADRSSEQSEELLQELSDIKQVLGRHPNNIEELSQTEEFMQSVPEKVKVIESKIAVVMKNYATLDWFFFKFSEDRFKQRYRVYGGPKSIGDSMAKTKKTLSNEKESYADEQKDEQEQFKQKLKQLEADVGSFAQHTDLGRINLVSQRVKDVRKRISDAEEDARLYNSREALFGSDITEYSVISQMNKAFEPFEVMWTTTADWLKCHEEWMELPFPEIDSNELDRIVTTYNRNLVKSVKSFEKKGLNSVAKVASTILDQVEAFAPHIPLISAMRHPGMRERHWNSINAKLGFTIDINDPSFTLKKALDESTQLVHEKNTELVVKVGEVAAKEYQIEIALDKMEGEWSDVNLEIVPYKETGTYVLRGFDELQALLDEHVTMTQAMSFSAFKDPFEERITNWDRQLSLVSEVLDAWMAVQRNWLYLQPIFDSPDINKQLPTEGKRFATVDKNWRQTLASAHAHPLAIKFCASEKLLDKWEECNKFLDMVSKGLSDYLETKRAAFSRFYFLSNDELLEILSETKDPTNVQPHLKKCFEGINRVEFDEKSNIVAMISREKESVPFDGIVDPKGANVEDWMTALDNMMSKSIKKVMYEKIVAYFTQKRTDWIQEVPGQVAINGSQFHWTKEIEEYIVNEGVVGMAKAFDQQAQQISDMVTLVRSPSLTKLARKTLSAMTVIDVHARDVTEQLRDEKVDDVDAFLWISQMRFYWTTDAESKGTIDSGLDGNLYVHMVSSKRPYGYEYLGNSFRLVITPLTDKCYLTLMGALQMTLGGAPAGPAGTGKTETVKDLAKATAMQCVVFNCSDGLDYLAMGKFFKGLATCGAWACFDEFNRIDIEVLSVVAQQIMTLQNAAKSGEYDIMFEGTQILLNPLFSVYITMNPGYAGRTELPDNLAALFRPVAMMVPDYALIGEIMLYSFGYEKARICAQKMVATFTLCSEQLSSQDHYDYGMRAVKTVIMAAGNLKRAEPNTDEEILLMRALQDVNLPKFLSQDLPLFKGIISDLFPGIKRPDIDYGELTQCLKLSSEALKLQFVPFFQEKCVQLYETIVVRHGLMVVGPTGGGKSRNIQCLDKTLGLLKSRGVEGFAFEKVVRHSINPKAITMGQLYGEFDANTHEWQDGILASLLRHCIKDTTPDRKWIVFDGPVDAIWIENMNTVLDDNKKLCLNSGEMLPLSDQMTMMFEVEDLEVASPATVSRVGIVYMEPETLGLEPPIRSWMENLPEALDHRHLRVLQTLFDTYVASAISFLRRNFKEPVPTVDNNLVASLMRMLDCFLVKFEVKEGVEPPSEAAMNKLADDIESIFMFCFVWSVCCTVDRNGRALLSAWLRTQMQHHAAKNPFPPEGQVFDYCYFDHCDEEGNVIKTEWTPWLKTIAEYEYNNTLSFAETIIPTQDSTRYTYLLDLLVKNGKHVLMTGPTGTGKTVNIQQYFGKMKSSFIPLCLTFSAQTSANQTQDIIDSKCEKRRKGVYGPPVGRKFVVFIDDLNMPKREEYFAQPPIEIVRQWFTYGGWFDRKTLAFNRIVDVIMCAAMGPPGGGRNPVTPRMLRHYSIINYTLMQPESMQIIYQTILSNFLSHGGFDERLAPMAEQIVSSTIVVYNTICEQLLPTPAKSHYTFNLRDLGKVFQGMLMVHRNRVAEPLDLIRAWAHENQRVFKDRLINDEDREWLNTRLGEQVNEKFSGEGLELSWDKVSPEGVALIFTDFLQPGADNPIYEEVTDVPALLPLVEEYLADFNAESRSPMNLVMFMDAIQHVCRISRVLRQPLGNALLLGVGGSGRQSLTRLATFIAEYICFQVEIAKGYGMPEWREDVKRCLMLAGIEDKPVTFLFVDTQIINEQMLEDINGILNSGDIPNLYGPEDMESIANTCRIECQKKRIPPTKINIFNQYLIRVKRNIHLVLCMSPGTAIFRDRLRMFPSLVNCCTIDWFSEWPDEALKSVGMGIMQEVDLKLGEHLPSVVELFKFVHQSVASVSGDYYAELRRYNYVTPTSYLELLNTFKVLLQQKRVEVGDLLSRLQVGLDKLMSTAEVVADLQIELTAMQPNLIKTQAEVETMIVQIAKDKEAAAETKAIVSKEEEAATIKAAKTKEIADDAQRDLDEALPALDQAVACLSKLKKSDLDEVKNFKKPPGGVILTMEAACIMFRVRPVLKNDPDNIGKKIKDYWEAAQKNILVNSNKFLQDLIDFDKDNIPEKVIEQIEPYIVNPAFMPEEIEKASKACTAICMWSRAMYKYHNVAKAVEPKKKLLAEAQEQLDETLASLNVARSKLKDVEDRIKELEAQYDKSNAQKEKLEHDVEQCSQRLQRAEKLIGSLGSEKERWKDSVAGLNIDYTNLVGDVLVSSGCIAYLGPFTSTYRDRLSKMWIKKVSELNVPHSENCEIVKTLGEPVTIRAWSIAGLPSDNTSIQNGIVMSIARRWPLLIDPQTQANRFIKNLGKDKSNAPNGIETIKQTDKNFMRTLENGVRFGKWILLEGIGEKLDAALEPILQQQTFKQGSQLMIRLGDSTVPYNDSFKFFMTTKLPNPHYPPEVAVKVSLLNFAITPLGLEDQLLGDIMETELPEKEEKKNMLVVNNAKMEKDLKDIEDTILRMLSNSKGNILDDHELIETLATSKETSKAINIKKAEAEVTEKEIDAERERYRPVAFRGSLLFFCIADLRVIDPMYEYSLQWFTALFIEGIKRSEPAENVEDRIVNLNNYFTFSLYTNICRSLFERHKLLFSFSLVIKVLQGDDKINAEEWRFLLSGQAPGTPPDMEKPDASWVEKKSWAEICMVSALSEYAGFAESFSEDIEEWHRYFESNTCYKDALPGKWQDKLNLFQKMLVLRAIRPDKMVEAIQQYVIAEFGHKFIEPPPFDLGACFADSIVTTPLIFVLTSGCDPTADFFKFAEKQRKKIESISLGQGQGPLALKLIREGQERGSWVMLQNCHLASSFMGDLERVCDEIDKDEVHKDFRLWLTSMPTKIFPVSVLQNGVKMTKEPPAGMRANLRSAYYSMDNEKIDKTDKPKAYKKLLFGLCFFHALIQERRRFGPLGWNIRYEFNDTDLDISISQLEFFLNLYDDPPFKVLNVLTSYINYGGRVTDAIDLRVIDVILLEFYTREILDDDYKFSPSGYYGSCAINEEDPHQGYMDYIDSLPVNAEPEVFGMHSNANITCALNETYAIFDTLLALQPRVSSGTGKSREEIISDSAKDIESHLPNNFDIEAVQMKYPVTYNESMNTVLVQEAIRYQRLLIEMKKTLADLQKALVGLVVLSSELELMGDYIFMQKIPVMWEAKAYPSLKPLASWTQELLERLSFINQWIANGSPAVYWISGFFFPQAFITGTRQNFARKYVLPIDEVGLNSKIKDQPRAEVVEKPEDGCYIYGLFIEGARWDSVARSLADSEPKTLYTEMPVIHFDPERGRKPPESGHYRCPIYKILSRAGTLSTTGHSTNFVMWFEIPTSGPTIKNNIGMADSKRWIKAGVACFCSLKF